MIDPRTSIIDDRLREVGRIIAVSSGKGGVGKSLIASTMALLLAREGYKVGLFDLDFSSPSTHLILGIREIKPREELGIVPPVVHGLKYMSIVYYSGEHAVPLRGADTSNALIELLSITRWENLDFLVIDMPPGIGDATLDMLRFIKRIEFLVVTTPSQLAFETVRKLVSLLKGLNAPIVGVVENMKMGSSNSIKEKTLEIDVKFLEEIPFDPKVEEAIGDVNKLLNTMLAKKVKEIASKIVREQ
jgi:ATP-binding protein involved in chromosome partitioning